MENETSRYFIDFFYNLYIQFTLIQYWYNFLEVEKAICPITGEPAKYKDPKSGVPYANLEAYKRLQQILKHEYLWSSEKGTFVIKSSNSKKRNAIKAKKGSNRVNSRIKIVKTWGW